MKKNEKTSDILCITFYSLLHALVDFSCVLILFASFRSHPLEIWGFLLYSFCAFALQFPLGILADAVNHNERVAAVGCLMIATAYCFPSLPFFCAVVAGIGNACFHLGGGLDILNRSGSRTAPAGIFVAPGALGLWLGTRLSSSGYFSVLPAFFLIPAALLLLLCFEKKFSRNRSNEPFSVRPKISLPLALTASALLFAVVVLRSFSGFSFSFSWASQGIYPVLLILAVVGGKIVGGILSDRLGAALSGGITLLFSAVLFLFSSWPAAGITAVFLFNMTMPITLTACTRIFPGAKGMSFGLMTLALFLGYLPVVFGLHTENPVVYLILCVGSALFLVSGLILSSGKTQ